MDVGSRRIGVAISDPDGIMALPLKVIGGTSRDDAAEQIREMLREYDVGRIIVGMPRSLDGTLGKQAVEVEDFVSFLSQQTSVAIDTWDERLSTVTANRMAAEAGRGRGRGRKEVDDLAAVVILQGYLDRANAQ